MNYFLKDIDLTIPFSNKNKDRIKSLQFYDDAADRILGYFGKRQLSNYQLNEQCKNSSEVHADIVYNLALADSTFDPQKGTTEYSWRNYHGSRAIDDVKTSYQCKKNQPKVSLDHLTDPNTIGFYHASLEDKRIKEPEESILDAERRDRVARYTNFLRANAGLSETQQFILNQYYNEGVDNFEEIGKMPEIDASRQYVQQEYQKAIEKLRLTALGTSGEPQAD